MKNYVLIETLEKQVYPQDQILIINFAAINCDITIALNFLEDLLCHKIALGVINRAGDKEFNFLLEEFAYQNTIGYYDYDFVHTAYKKFSDYLKNEVNVNDSYGRLAKYYEEIQADIDIKPWLKLTKKYLKETDYVVEAACGTGSFIAELQHQNYLGYDLSKPMIEIANQKTKHLFQVGNMLEFKQFDVDLYICFLDSVNYLKTLEDVQIFFENVYESLREGGHFIFDIHMLKMVKRFKKYEYAEQFQEFEYYQKSTVIDKNFYHYFVFVDDYVHLELHEQFFYDLLEIRKTLTEIGFKVIEVQNQSNHHMIVAQK
ncbi:MAG: class I SAM-dependent DNA methyltransferase [Mycoplasmatales bacterium]